MDERSANQYLFNVYCPECPPGGIIVYPGGQQKRFLLFGHGRDLLHSTVLAYSTVEVFSLLGRDKQGLNRFGKCRMSCASGPYTLCSVWIIK